MTENGLANDFSKLNIRMYTYFFINGILLLFAYPLLFLLEKTFGFTSNVTLVELSNINNDLLRQMSETVPGTFQHSMQVANLAAEAAIRIGAKSQCVPELCIMISGKWRIRLSSPKINQEESTRIKI